VHKLVRSTLRIATVVLFAATSQLVRANPPDACALLSPAEIGGIVGTPMGTGVALNSSTTSSCKWLQQGVDEFRAVTVIISTKSAQAFEMGKSAIQPTAVSGIGDEAYMTGKSQSYTVLSARKGQNALTVTVRGLKDIAATQTAEKALGKAAIARL
jgi:hypothetical protein